MSSSPPSTSSTWASRVDNPLSQEQRRGHRGTARPGRLAGSRYWSVATGVAPRPRRRHHHGPDPPGDSACVFFDHDDLFYGHVIIVTVDPTLTPHDGAFGLGDRPLPAQLLEEAGAPLEVVDAKRDEGDSLFHHSSSAHVYRRQKSHELAQRGPAVAGGVSSAGSTVNGPPCAPMPSDCPVESEQPLVPPSHPSSVGVDDS
jgi:hypothetical protein